MKKKHWTQLPENKAKVRAMAKKGGTVARMNEKKNLLLKPQRDLEKRTRGLGKKTLTKLENVQQEKHITFAFGFIQAWITEHSRRTGISQRILAQRLAEFLSEPELW